MGCKYIKLNLSQREIAMSELASGGSAVNTIAVRLHLPDTSASQAEPALNAALASADIFTARLDRGAAEWRLMLDGCEAPRCMVLNEMFLAEARSHAAAVEGAPFELDGSLCRVELIPLAEGGCLACACFHHIIIDGYGMSLFVQRVLDALAGKNLAPSCFAENSGCTEAAEDADFWRGCFAEASFEPSIFPEKGQGLSGNRLTRPLSNELQGRIAAFAAENKLTEAYVFAAAYALYLAQATDRPDAVFLMPRLGREPSQMDVLGCYTLLVPLRVHMEREASFAQLCASVAQAARLASAHKNTGYDRILSILRDADLASDTLSEYVFNFYRFRWNTSIPCDIRISVAGGMRNHVTLNIFSGASGSRCLALDYHDGAYTPERAQSLAEALAHILSQGVDNPAVAAIQPLGEAERQAASVMGKSFPVDESLTIPSLFRRAAQAKPDAPALYAGEVSLSFAQLDHASDAIATALVQRGVHAGDCVAFMLRRDWRILPTILGISKAGAAFIPVDPAYPADRVAYIIENSRAAYMISSKDVPGADRQPYLEADELLACPPDVASLPLVKQDQLAYVIYTSGTTGRPKGVMLSHRGIANITHPDNNPFNRDVVKNCRGIVAIGSVCFDISLFEIFVPLMNGLFVEYGGEKAMVDAAELAALVRRHGADILHCTPSRIAAYLSNADFAACLKGVHAILAAGEVLPGSLVTELRDSYGIRVYNGYGPTEVTIGATITEAGDCETIGSPIANTGVVMLNKDRNSVPYGAVGEIGVWGNGVGIGYKDRPEETSAKYILWQGKRLYLTGDLGRFREDGRIIYHGRNDRQIKLRGLRIELSEIEKVMGEYSGVAACNVLVRKVDRSEHLAGFYTVAVGCQVDPQALREFMKSRLTSYMVPDILKELPAMPQTPGGKTDLKALAAVPVEYTRAYRKPVSHREIAICTVFEQTLKLERVGMDDNFFELGGSSLDAAGAMLAIEDKLSLGEGRLDFGDLYKYPTPALLLEHISGGMQPDAGYDLSKENYAGIDAYLAASAGQPIEKKQLGNVLLTGATGYLGVHILMDLLRRPDCCGRIICLARASKRLSAQRRVKSSLFYYAEEDFSDSYGDKWLVVEGDITSPEVLAEACDMHIDTIINSAANVAHFAYGDTLKKSNTDGVKNLIDLALRHGATLCQISTISVAGATDGSALKDGFTERDFYIGQRIHNQYIYSKYMAEYLLLRAAVDQGLPIKLLRVGNLQGRIQDGEFQMNMSTNAFTRQLAAYIKIGAVPRSLYEASVNFSPVDETAHNIISLCATAGGAAYNVYPPREVPFAAIFAGLERLGHGVEVVDDEAFTQLLQRIKRTEKGREQAEGLFTRGLDGNYRDIPVEQELTNKYIAALGEGWTEITDAYLNKYLSALEGMDLF